MSQHLASFTPFIIGVDNQRDLSIRVNQSSTGLQMEIKQVDMFSYLFFFGFSNLRYFFIFGGFSTSNGLVVWTGES
jgi:hypothetical protein